MRDRKALVAVLLVAAAAVYAAGSSSARTNDHRGGTLKLLAKAAGGTLDPQVNYTLEYWQLYQASYDGLLAFKKAGGNAAFDVVPDLASGYKIKNGGKTWVFNLRKGIKFSNGQTLTPNDVAASFRRIFKVKSPTSGTFYAGIVGAQACLARPATCTLKGGVIANDKCGGYEEVNDKLHSMARHLGSPYHRFYPGYRPQPSSHNRLCIVRRLSLVGQVLPPGAQVVGS